MIEIWAPRYHDNVVLIDVRKVSERNIIMFTKAKHLLGQKFYVDKEDIVNSPIDTNGSIKCYAVPMTKLEPITETV